MTHRYTVYTVENNEMFVRLHETRDPNSAFVTAAVVDLESNEPVVYKDHENIEDFLDVYATPYDEVDYDFGFAGNFLWPETEDAIIRAYEALVAKFEVE